MKRSSLLIATLLAFGLGACGEQQKPAPKSTPSAPAKPEAAAPAPPPPPAPMADTKKDEKK
jgi:hypothetical protein